MARGRLQLSITTAALCAAVVALADARQGPERALLLPDLVQAPPSDVKVRRSGGEVRLGFASAVSNAGSGPLIIRGSRPSRRRAAMTATQLVLREDGSRPARRPAVGVLRYTRSPDHDHWHLLRFDRYRLQRADGRGRAVALDRKSGFCLGDRYDATPGSRLGAEPAEPAYETTCGLSRPDLLRVGEGISVGYGDDYAAYLEGQHLDITGLAAGDYVLVHTVNADRRLLEERYDNNAACVVLRLAYPGGRAALPTVTPRASACAPTSAPARRRPAAG